MLEQLVKVWKKRKNHVREFSTDLIDDLKTKKKDKPALLV